LINLSYKYLLKNVVKKFWETSVIY